MEKNNVKYVIIIFQLVILLNNVMIVTHQEIQYGMIMNVKQLHV